MSKRNRQFKDWSISLTSDGDTDEYGAVVWFGTADRAAAVKKLHKLARKILDVNFKTFKKVRKIET